MTLDVANIAGVILAAGGSSRLGRPKQLLRVGGLSLLRRTAEAALAAGLSPLVAVVAPELTEARDELAGLAIELVANPGWRSGIASSIQAGVRRLEPFAVEAAMLIVCDQPLLTADHMAALMATYRAGFYLAVASQYGGAPGTPALFSRRLFPELLVLAGDTGAKSVLRAHSSEIALVQWPDGAVDLDTDEDAEKFRWHG